MTFDRAVALVPYLARLGISHLYASPIFTATKGSTHGYDVTDVNEIDPAIGGIDGFQRLVDTLSKAGMGLILDIVPNHMAASLENAWWRGVVEWGEASPHAHYFDIDWTRRLTLPILGRPLEAALQAGELRLAVDRTEGALAIGYFDHLIPLNPATYPDLVAAQSDPLSARILKLAAHALPGQMEKFHRNMRDLLKDSKAVSLLEYGLDRLCQQSDGALRHLIDRQPWQLLFWEDAAGEISYRRFFEITGLVGLRVEDGAVFEASHRLVSDLVRSGRVEGLRIDHIDGLADPRAYLERLRVAVGPEVYIVVEKILGSGETLPRNWPVDGTTGYEFIAALTNVFLDRGGLTMLDDCYGKLAPDQADFETGVRNVKEMLAAKNFAAETEGLLRLLDEIAALEKDEISRGEMETALRALLTSFRVYRSYATASGLDADDSALWNTVVQAAAVAEPAVDSRALSLIVRAFRGEIEWEGAALFRQRFQQLTGPLTAKAVEDTMFFRDNRLLALNEVGGNPADRSLSLERFHEAMALRALSQPRGLSATATHDTKRGEDARARLYAISEAAEHWCDAVRRWRRMNASSVAILRDGPAPEAFVEWMLYQALAGARSADFFKSGVPEELEQRFLAFVEKALREAKQRTNWGRENSDYEAAVKAYAARLLSPDNKAFLADFRRTVRSIAIAGLFNGLSQTLIKLVAPGVPDIYQGTEGLDLSLVDPDNRRPPDFERLALRDLAEPLMLDEIRLTEGRLKQGLIARCLAFRLSNPRLVANGSYRALQASGPRSGQIVAFIREFDHRFAIAVAPRMVFGAGPSKWPCGDYWRGTSLTLPGHLPARLRDVLDDRLIDAAGKLDLSKTLVRHPLALLAREG
jgi:(1->4)-alpha-D-glucan 1-alpha-D-glucosylmutase